VWASAGQTLVAVDGDAVADLSLSCISERIKGVLGSLGVAPFGRRGRLPRNLQRNIRYLLGRLSCSIQRAPGTRRAAGTWHATGALGSTATLLLSDDQVSVAILSLVASFATGREALACTASDDLAEAHTHSHGSAHAPIRTGGAELAGRRAKSKSSCLEHHCVGTKTAST
jgi:hypothetical protein